MTPRQRVTYLLRQYGPPTAFGIAFAIVGWALTFGPLGLVLWCTLGGLIWFVVDLRLWQNRDELARLARWAWRNRRALARQAWAKVRR